MYDLLLKYSLQLPVFGIVSDIRRQQNEKQIPAIYERMGGFTRGDFAYILNKNYEKNELIYVKESCNGS